MVDKFQKCLLSWEDEIDDLRGLGLLKSVLDTLPDEALINKLDKERGKGRNDFPVRPMWNLVIAGIIYQHQSVASLLRELDRNKQLAYVCGFYGGSKLPAEHNMSRFLSNLLAHEDEIKEMFVTLVRVLYSILGDFGKELAIDAKWIPSAAQRPSDRKNPDGRSESDAKRGVKTYHGIKPDGTPWEKTVTCFGFAVHLLVDSDYEIPVAYSVTDAGASDITEGMKLVEELAVQHPEVLERCEYFTADKGYDATALIEFLKEYGIKAVIDKRKMWKNQTEKEVPGYQNAYYDEAGNVYCYSPHNGTRTRMALNGYEKERGAVRFKCPAQAYGIECSEMDACKCKNIRIPLSTDPRIFTQVQRQSYKWKRFYKKRTAVERVNSRLDGAYRFEERQTRGLPRMKVYVGLALLVMLAIAVWCARNKKEDRIRSLLKIS